MSKTEAVPSFSSNKESLLNTIMNEISKYIYDAEAIKIINEKDLKTGENFLRVFIRTEKKGLGKVVFETKYEPDIDFLKLKEKIKLLGYTRIFRTEYKIDEKKVTEILIKFGIL
jgi:hypothetical protein